MRTTEFCFTVRNHAAIIFCFMLIILLNKA